MAALILGSEPPVSPRMLDSAEGDLVGLPPPAPPAPAASAASARVPVSAEPADMDMDNARLPRRRNAPASAARTSSRRGSAARASPILPGSPAPDSPAASVHSAASEAE
jgi:hypothetical protein